MSSSSRLTARRRGFRCSSGTRNHQEAAPARAGRRLILAGAAPARTATAAGHAPDRPSAALGHVGTARESSSGRRRPRSRGWGISRRWHAPAEPAALNPAAERAAGPIAGPAGWVQLRGGRQAGALPQRDSADPPSMEQVSAPRAARWRSAAATSRVVGSGAVQVGTTSAPAGQPRSIRIRTGSAQGSWLGRVPVPVWSARTTGAARGVANGARPIDPLVHASRVGGPRAPCPAGSSQVRTRTIGRLHAVAPIGIRPRG